MQVPQERRIDRQLSWYVELGDKDGVEYLLQHGADPNAYGTGLLSTALENKYLGITRLLLQYGADRFSVMHALDEASQYYADGDYDYDEEIEVYSNHLLMCAVEEGNAPEVEHYLRHDASPNAYGTYLLMEALERKYFGIIRILLHYGTYSNYIEEALIVASQYYDDGDYDYEETIRLFRHTLAVRDLHRMRRANTFSSGRSQ